MGDGDRYSAREATERIQRAQQHGDSGFTQSREGHATRVVTGRWPLDPLLDPKKPRVSDDSPNFPETSNVFIAMDITGSGGDTPKEIRNSMPKLMTGLLRSKLITDPTILISAFTDLRWHPEFCADIFVQTGEAEHDLRIHEWIERLVLPEGYEGQRVGGGNEHESADLVLWQAARHIKTANFRLRKKRDYMFLTTDELAYEYVDPAEIKKVFGKTIPAQIPISEIVEAVREKWILTVMIPRDARYGSDPRMYNFWSKLLGPDPITGLKNQVVRVPNAQMIHAEILETIEAHQQALSHLAG